MNEERPALFPVLFDYINPTARQVSVAGCFNNWHPEAETLHPSEGGHWVSRTALAPGTYQYCLVVDGEWQLDPMATDYIPNPFGGWNSVFTVPTPGTFPSSL